MTYLGKSHPINRSLIVWHNGTFDRVDVHAKAAGVPLATALQRLRKFKPASIAFLPISAAKPKTPKTREQIVARKAKRPKQAPRRQHPAIAIVEHAIGERFPGETLASMARKHGTTPAAVIAKLKRGINFDEAINHGNIIDAEAIEVQS